MTDVLAKAAEEGRKLTREEAHAWCRQFTREQMLLLVRLLERIIAERGQVNSQN